MEAPGEPEGVLPAAVKGVTPPTLPPPGGKTPVRPAWLLPGEIRSQPQTCPPRRAVPGRDTATNPPGGCGEARGTRARLPAARPPTPSSPSPAGISGTEKAEGEVGSRGRARSCALQPGTKHDTAESTGGGASELPRGGGAAGFHHHHLPGGRLTGERHRSFPPPLPGPALTMPAAPRSRFASSPRSFPRRV